MPKKEGQIWFFLHSNPFFIITPFVWLSLCPLIKSLKWSPVQVTIVIVYSYVKTDYLPVSKLLCILISLWHPYSHKEEFLSSLNIKHFHDPYFFQEFLGEPDSFLGGGPNLPHSRQNQRKLQLQTISNKFTVFIWFGAIIAGNFNYIQYQTNLPFLFCLGQLQLFGLMQLGQNL